MKLQSSVVSLYDIGMPSREDRIEEMVAEQDAAQDVKMVEVDLTPFIKKIYDKIRSSVWPYLARKSRRQQQ